jgi:hypothetical protein
MLIFTTGLVGLTELLLLLLLQMCVLECFVVSIGEQLYMF